MSEPAEKTLPVPGSTEKVVWPSSSLHRPVSVSELYLRPTAGELTEAAVGTLHRDCAAVRHLFFMFSAFRTRLPRQTFWTQPQTICATLCALIRAMMNRTPR